MKKIRNLVLFLLLLLSFYRCEENLKNDEPVQNISQFTVEQAQAWFGSEWAATISLKSGSTESPKIGIKPDWCDGFTSHNSKFDVVEVGLLVQGNFGFADQTSSKDWKMTKNPKMITSLTRMVFMKDKKNGRIDQFLMTIVGNKEYHDKKIGQLSDNSYFTREKHFSGYIFFHDLTGNFINGWNYEKGKIVRKCSQNNGNNLPIVLKKADCIAVTVTLYNQFCTDWYHNGQYNYTNCEDRVAEYEYYYLYCSYEPSGGGSGGGYDGEYYPPTTPDPITLNTQLNTLFADGTTLTDAEKEKLNNAYNEMINKCIYAYISNQLTNNNVTLGSISIDPTLPGVACVTSLGNLKFQGVDAITAENLEHEWVHLLQRYVSNIDIFDPSNQGMAEFENFLLTDVIECINLRGDFSIATHSFACYNMRDDDSTIEYQTWLKTLTENGTHYPSAIDIEGFLKFAKIFGEVHSWYNADHGYQFDNTSYQPISISNLFNNARTNCE